MYGRGKGMTERKVLFIHHSVGRMIIAAGLRQRLQASYIQLWDTDYNCIGAHNDAGQRVDTPLLPRDKTNPEDFSLLLKGDEQSTVDYIKWMRTFDGVILKSCYIAFEIEDALLLSRRISAVKDMIARSSELFKRTLLLTPPPLSKLVSSRYSKDYQMELLHAYTCIQKDNVKVFDLFKVLAEEGEQYLSKSYQRLLPSNSHPNSRGSVAAAAAMAESIIDLVQ